MSILSGRKENDLVARLLLWYVEEKCINKINAGVISVVEH